MFFKKKYNATLFVDGMSCAHCASRVEKALNELNISAKTDLAGKCVNIKANAPFDEEKIFSAISALGYTPVKLDIKSKKSRLNCKNSQIISN